MELLSANLLSQTLPIVGLNNLQQIDPNYVDADDYSPGYSPRDDFIMSVTNCNSLCEMLWGANIVLAMIHLYTNADQLEGWANGNVMLLLGTVWFVFISVWNMGMIVDFPELLALPQWQRTVPFAFAAMFNSYYYTALFALVWKIRQGGNWYDTTQEILFAYVVWLNTPSALVGTSYMVQMSMKNADAFDSSTGKVNGDDDSTNSDFAV